MARQAAPQSAASICWTKGTRRATSFSRAPAQAGNERVYKPLGGQRDLGPPQRSVAAQRAGPALIREIRRDRDDRLGRGQIPGERGGQEPCDLRGIENLESCTAHSGVRRTAL